MYLEINVFQVPALNFLWWQGSDILRGETTLGILLTVFAADEFHLKLFIGPLVGHEEKQKDSKSRFI